MVSGVGGPEGPLSYRTQGTQGPQVTAEARDLGGKISTIVNQIRDIMHSPASADNGQVLENLAATIEQLGSMIGRS